jgi:lysozyme
MDKQRLFKQLRTHEGVEKFPYKCTAGYLTIGVGRNIEERGLLDDEIDFLLDNDINIAIDEVAATYDWFFDLSEVRQRVIIDMVFNLGLPRFAQFKNMIAAIEAEDFVQASNEMMDSRWAQQVGLRASRLAEMMETDEDTTDF